MPNHDHELRSEEVQDILTRVPHWMIRWGNVIILIILVIIIFMSWIIKYPDVVSTQIIITTQTPPEKLIAKSSGRIQQILVVNQQRVSRGTPLAVIESTADYNDVFSLKEVTDTLVLKHDFIFPFDRLSNLTLGDVEAAYALFEKDYLAYKLNYELHPHRVEQNAQSYELIELNQRLSYLEQQRIISEKQLNIKTKELNRYKSLYEKGIIATQEWENKNIEFLDVEQTCKDISSSISQVRSSLNAINRDKKSTKINETKDEVNLYRNAVQSFQQLREAINKWEFAHVLRTRVTGTVSFLQIWKENQTINSGDNVFAIIPNEQNSFIGKIKAAALNSGKIRTGQEVNIRLSNFPPSEFGLLRGTVNFISLTPDKDGNLLIDVALPKDLRTSYNKTIKFQQEMSGTADIITEDLRLIERILYQFREIARR